MARKSPTEQSFRESGLPSDVIRVVNPTDHDFEFIYKNEQNIDIRYVIAPGAEKQWPRYLACYYAVHMIDFLIKNEVILPNDPFLKEKEKRPDVQLPKTISDAVRREQLFNMLIVETIQTDVGVAMPPEEQRIQGDEYRPATEYGTPAQHTQAAAEDPSTKRDYAAEIKQITDDPGTEAQEDEAPNDPVKTPEPPKKPAKPRRKDGKFSTKRPTGKATMEMKK